MQGHNSVEDWKYYISEDIKHLGKVDMVLYILKKPESRHYASLKGFLLVDLRLCSQFVLTSSFRKNAMSVASKVGIQINTKIGGIPWEIINSNKYIKSKRFCYGAISTSRTGSTNTISFVGSVSASCSKKYSNYWILKKKEDVPSEFYKETFHNWIKSYVVENKKFPELFILYRESAGDSQQKELVQEEVRQLKNEIENIRNKKNRPDFQP